MPACAPFPLPPPPTCRSPSIADFASIPRTYLIHTSYIPSTGASRTFAPNMNQFQPSPSSRTNSTMQAMPDSRSQSFEEIYGPPENFLEIEVSRVNVLMPLQSLTCARPPGMQPANPRSHTLVALHDLRDPPEHKHSLIQAAQQQRAPPLF